MRARFRRLMKTSLQVSDRLRSKQDRKGGAPSVPSSHMFSNINRAGLGAS